MPKMTFSVLHELVSHGLGHECNSKSCSLRWPDSHESFQVPDLNPFSCELHLEALKIANRSFEAIRANRSLEAIHANHSNVTKIGFFFGGGEAGA